MENGVWINPDHYNLYVQMELGLPYEFLELPHVQGGAEPLLPIDIYAGTEWEGDPCPPTPRLESPELTWADAIDEALSTPKITTPKPIKTWSIDECFMLLAYSDKLYVNWQDVAKRMETEVTASQCRQKFYSLMKKHKPTLVKPHVSPKWSQEDMKKMLDIKLRHPHMEWPKVANLLGRSATSCKIKYSRLLLSKRS